MEQRNQPIATIEEFERRVSANIKNFGWHVTLVLEESGIPGWGYSIGFFRSFRHPEVVVFGLPKNVTHSLLNCIGDEIQSGKSFESGGRYHGLLEGVSCHFQQVEECWYGSLLGQAVAFYGGIKFPMLQCVWPDKHGNYPWDAGFKRDWFWAQPLLFHSDPKRANAEALLRAVHTSK